MNADERRYRTRISKLPICTHLRKSADKCIERQSLKSDCYFKFTRSLSLLSLALNLLVANITTSAETDLAIEALIANGSFAEAESRLREQVVDPSAPITSEAAIQLEILRRTRHDFALTNDDVLKQIKESVPDATPGGRRPLARGGRPAVSHRSTARRDTSSGPCQICFASMPKPNADR